VAISAKTITIIVRLLNLNSLGRSGASLISPPFVHYPPRRSPQPLRIARLDALQHAGAVPSPESVSGAWALFLSPDPLIDFPCFNNASFWLMRADRASRDVVCLRKHHLRKPLGLSLGRESFGLSRVPRPTNRSDRNEPAIDRLGQNGSPRAASGNDHPSESPALAGEPEAEPGRRRSRFEKRRNRTLAHCGFKA
jgi:hypothetical protein